MKLLNSIHSNSNINGLAAGSFQSLWDSKSAQQQFTPGQPVYITGVLTGGTPDSASASQGFPLELICQYNAINVQDRTSNFQQHKVILFPGNGRCSFGVCMPAPDTDGGQNLRVDILARNPTGNAVGGMSGLASLNVRTGLGRNYINNVWCFRSASISDANTFCRFWGTAGSEGPGSTGLFVRNDASVGIVDVDGGSYTPTLYGGPHYSAGIVSTTVAAGGTYDTGYTSQRCEFPGFFFKYTSSPTGGAAHASGKV